MLWVAVTYVYYVQCQTATIVNFVFLLELALAALPPGAEDEIILIEHLPGRRVHLQDFFWTAAEDTPTWLSPIITLYKTHTIQHTTTIYVTEDSIQQQMGDMHNHQSLECVSCIKPTPTFIDNVNENVNMLLDNDPGPRYWLLTVLKAGESVPSKVELRLARLYKAAFTRQQQKHLGLLPEIHVRNSFSKRETITQNQTTGDLKARRALLVELESRNDTHSKPVSNVNVGLVQVRMHNTSLMETGATKLIYTVHLGGKPVPAETAAKDMALLSAQEVALELGTPVLIQSEPYLKESRPLALSKKRDALLLVGATSLGVFLLLIIVFGLFVLTKHKHAKDSGVIQPNHKILIKDEEYAPMTSDVDNTAYIAETERRNTAKQNVCDATRENNLEELKRRQEHVESWNTENYTGISRPEYVYFVPLLVFRHVQRANIVNDSQSPESIGSTGIQIDNLNPLEKSLLSEEVLEESMGSPYSYLSMPSCKQFPSMRSVEPLSKVLESTIMKNLDVEFEPPEIQARGYNLGKENDYGFSRTLSAGKDPGVLGPIVWDLKRKRAVEGMGNIAPTPAKLESEVVPQGPVGRARKRLNELFEDSSGRVEVRETKQQSTCEKQQQSDARCSLQWYSLDSESRVKIVYISMNRITAITNYCSEEVAPTFEETLRSHISVPRNNIYKHILESEYMGPHPRGAWGSCPLSAGPFHKPTFPEVEVVRVLADSQLQSEDSAVSFIAAIKKELGKFTFEKL
ncbi:PREDICTED: uncharacterized protein LOC105366735 [Ceratosolen solmsi marchali]|uniref:Uncharacterized protein LOC105366735 n=1 Tax=Ceratosolen solmsi marchali TaxID=326594 RepID=A0AAJ6YSV8_9HYME|nr:PREDICTED: uncharacterized protein LOC105366735 [Ceratosolen solmsi marchali]